MASMTLEQFAKKAGVSFRECEPDWGGRVAYTTKGDPRYTVAGFRTEKAALKHWMESTFGKDAAKALSSLLKKDAA